MFVLVWITAFLYVNTTRHTDRIFLDSMQGHIKQPQQSQDIKNDIILTKHTISNNSQLHSNTTTLCNIHNICDKETLLAHVQQKFQALKPKQWSENPKGAINRIQTDRKILFLTFDACGGDYDSQLIAFLNRENIKATLFINGRWIDSHYNEFVELAKNPLFSIQNHGTKHRPLSVESRQIYGIESTHSIQEVFHEIYENDIKITNITGKKPTFFRSGTAYYDDIAMQIANEMGYKIAGFDIVGDGGGKFSIHTILQQAKNTQNGSILIYHFNKPKSNTRKSLEILIPQWKAMGYEFGLLE